MTKRTLYFAPSLISVQHACRASPSCHLPNLTTYTNSQLQASGAPGALIWQSPPGGATQLLLVVYCAQRNTDIRTKIWDEDLMRLKSMYCTVSDNTDLSFRSDVSRHRHDRPTVALRYSDAGRLTIDIKYHTAHARHSKLGCLAWMTTTLICSIEQAAPLHARPQG